MQEPAIRVLLVEDHAVVRKGLRALLATPRFRIDVVGEAADGVEAVALAQQLQPDVIVMDLEMPRMGGVAAIKSIKGENPQARVLVLTSFGEAERALEAVRAGAVGFLHKDSSPDDLVNAIRSVYHGQLSLPGNLASALWGEEKASAAADGVALTEREHEILGGIVRGLSNKEIARELHISSNTVRSHIRSILSKFGVANRTQAAMYAIENDLISYA